MLSRCSFLTHVGAARRSRGAAERATRLRAGHVRALDGELAGDEAEREASRARLRVLAPIICLLYAFGYS